MTNPLTIQELEQALPQLELEAEGSTIAASIVRPYKQLLAAMRQIESLKALRVGQEKAHDTQMEYGAELYQRTLKENQRLREALEYYARNENWSRIDRRATAYTVFCADQGSMGRIHGWQHAQQALAVNHELPYEYPAPDERNRP